MDSNPAKSQQEQNDPNKAQGSIPVGPYNVGFVKNHAVDKSILSSALLGLVLVKGSHQDRVLGVTF